MPSVETAIIEPIMIEVAETPADEDEAGRRGDHDCRQDQEDRVARQHPGQLRWCLQIEVTARHGRTGQADASTQLARAHLLPPPPGAVDGLDRACEAAILGQLPAAD